MSCDLEVYSSVFAEVNFFTPVILIQGLKIVWLNAWSTMPSFSCADFLSHLPPLSPFVLSIHFSTEKSSCTTTSHRSSSSINVLKGLIVCDVVLLLGRASICSLHYNESIDTHHTATSYGGDRVSSINHRQSRSNRGHVQISNALYLSMFYCEIAFKRFWNQHGKWIAYCSSLWLFVLSCYLYHSNGFNECNYHNVQIE